MTDVSRRSFLKSASLMATGSAMALAAGSMTGCAKGEKQSIAGTIEWTDEADLVILGTGNAGLCAAIATMNENLGTALIMEAAPKEFRGGNSRVSGQLVFCPVSVEGAIEYQTACNEPYTVAPELVKAWAEEICKNKDWLVDVIGLEMVVSDRFNPEYPELPAADSIEVYVNYEEGIEPNDGKLETWNHLMAKVEEYGVPVYYDTRGTELIKDLDGTIIGVKSEDGRSFKAKKGVILACGGFEANPELMNEHYAIGFNDVPFRGTPYNRGDGIEMAKRAGADFWHMNAFVGNAKCVNVVKGEQYSGCQISPGGKDFIYMGPDGMRCMNEDFTGCLRHGKYNNCGQWVNLEPYAKSWVLMGQTSFDKGIFKDSNSFAAINLIGRKYPSCQKLMDDGLLTKCETVEDIAKFTRLDANVVQYTIDHYNELVAANLDTGFGRGIARDKQGYPEGSALYGGKASVKAYDLVPLEFPLYVTNLYTTILNTQGGPKRSAFGEVLDYDGNPIPRLYSAGELGTIYANMYNGGGNYSEAMSSGRIAARNAAALTAWE